MAEEYTYSRTRYERELFINRREFLWTSLPWKSEIMKKAKRMSLLWSRLISTLTARLQRKDEERRRRRRRILWWWIKLNSFAICPTKVFELQPLWVSSLIHIASQKSYILHFQLSRIPRLSSAHWSRWSDLNLLLKVWLDLNESLLDGFYDLLCRVQFRTVRRNWKTFETHFLKLLEAIFRLMLSCIVHHKQDAFVSVNASCHVFLIVFLKESCIIFSCERIVLDLQSFNSVLG